MTPDYTKFIDSCSYHKLRSMQIDIYIFKTLWLEITPALVLFQLKISTPGPAPEKC